MIPIPGSIFVFGSNRAGRHGAGAAKWAILHRGAIYGQGEGLQGMCYAIPTKDGALKVLSLNAIRMHVDRFISFAKHNPELTFQLTPIGCGLAGYSPHAIAPLFRDAPGNVVLPQPFQYIRGETSDDGSEKPAARV